MRVVLLILAGAFLCKNAFAAIPEDWKVDAIMIVRSYEGSDFGAVTEDSDGQGISVGNFQYTIKSKSIGELFNAVGVEKAKQLARDKMPHFGRILVQVIDLVGAGKYDEARTVSQQFQSKDTKSGKWHVLPAAEAELRTWLTLSDVERAQTDLQNNILNQAWEAAWRWKDQAQNEDELTFSEFLFFVDAGVQGGLEGYTDGSYAAATKRVKEGTEYVANSSEELRKAQLIDYLSSWLKVEWPSAADKRYYLDAQKNADILESRKKSITINQLQLLYIKYLRGSTGNIPYMLTYVNRGVIDVFGDGWIGQTQRNDVQKVFEKHQPVKRGAL